MTFTIYVVGLLVSIFCVSIFVTVSNPNIKKMNPDDIMLSGVLYLVCVVWFISIPIILAGYVGHYIGNHIKQK